MTVSLSAMLLFCAFMALVAIATASNGGNWFHVGEAASTVVIVAGLMGLLSRYGSRRG